MEGALDRLVTSGTLSLDNTRLAGFDLGSKMAFLEALAGVNANPNTEIQTLGASFRASPAGTQVENLRLVVPSIGNLEGAGSVSPSNALAFQMRAAVRGVRVPFLIQGTESDRAFRPDVEGMAKQELKTITGKDGVKGLLKGMFGK